MPLAGKGMLLTSMDIDPSDEADFNRWYDREHLEERVAIDGFLEARRYVAHQGRPKYLCLYSTATFDVLDSPAYRAALANPTDWSTRDHGEIPQDDSRGRARHDQPRAGSRGGARHHPPSPPAGGEDALRAALRENLDPAASDRIISMHLIESDPALSRPITNNSAAADPGAGDWFALIDGTDVNAVSAVLTARLRGSSGDQIRHDFIGRLQPDVGPCQKRHPGDS